MSEKFYITSYTEGSRQLWDDAASRARQNSFLFQRDFMDYHRDRFKDASLIAFDNHRRPLALLPASLSNLLADSVESHGGLTYGGLLLPPSTTTADTCDILRAMLEYYHKRGINELLYKPVPHIYHTYPAEEGLYALSRCGARLCSRAVSSVIDLRAPYPFSTLRRRKVHKAESHGKFIFCDDSTMLDAFWKVLDDVLQKRHNTRPVHTVEEMRLLMKRFPNEIRLFTAVSTEHRTLRVVAGCLLFLTEKVAHVQYIAASDEGCQNGALDWLFQRTITCCQEEAAQRPWFDFGISTERNGTLLNEGLIFQKEGFGGRAVCYDSYLLSTQPS